jgi:hypothetical protein
MSLGEFDDAGSCGVSNLRLVNQPDLLGGKISLVYESYSVRMNLISEMSSVITAKSRFVDPSALRR